MRPVEVAAASRHRPRRPRRPRCRRARPGGRRRRRRRPGGPRRVDHVHAAAAQRRQVLLHGRVLPHLGVHGRAHHHRGPGGEQGGGEQVVGDAGGVGADEPGGGRARPAPGRPSGRAGCAGSAQGSSHSEVRTGSEASAEKVTAPTNRVASAVSTGPRRRRRRPGGGRPRPPCRRRCRRDAEDDAAAPERHRAVVSRLRRRPSTRRRRRTLGRLAVGLAPARARSCPAAISSKAIDSGLRATEVTCGGTMAPEAVAQLTEVGVDLAGPHGRQADQRELRVDPVRRSSIGGFIIDRLARDGHRGSFGGWAAAGGSPISGSPSSIPATSAHGPVQVVVDHHVVGQARGPVGLLLGRLGQPAASHVLGGRRPRRLQAGRRWSLRRRAGRSRISTAVGDALEDLAGALDLDLEDHVAPRRRGRARACRRGGRGTRPTRGTRRRRRAARTSLAVDERVGVGGLAGPPGARRPRPAQPQLRVARRRDGRRSCPCPTPPGPETTMIAASARLRRRACRSGSRGELLEQRLALVGAEAPDPAGLG